MTTRRTSEILERTEVICLVVLIVATPTVFLRNTFSTFDVPQVTVLWLSAMTLGFLVLVRRLLFERDATLPRVVMVAAAVFLVSLGLNVAFSPQPWVALTGLPVRSAGALTYGLCLLVLYSVYSIVTRRGPVMIVTAFVVAHAFVSGYALLQAYGGDPYQWGEGELWVGPVFSTLGNPNFSAAYLALTLPFVALMSLGFTNSRGVRMLCGAILGATTVALSYLGSFQGDVAALASVAVVVHWAWYRDRDGRLLATVLAAPAALVIVGVPLLFQQPSRTVLVALVACLAVAAWLSAKWDLRHPVLDDPVAIGWARRRIVLVSSSVVVVVAAITLVAGGRIVDELRAGLGQRVEFWRISLAIFREHPVVGTGLETYSGYFTSHRSISHAVKWEPVLADSPHSVPLGLLSGGGLLLATSYALLVGLVGWFGYRAVSRTGGRTRLLVMAVLMAWVAYQVQSLVSIDMPGLISTQWIFGGVLLAIGGLVEDGADTRETESTPLAHRALLNRVALWRWFAVSLATVVWFVSLGPVTAPFRADLAAGQAQQALDRGDVQTGGELLLRAIELQPRRSLYADGMALVYSESDLYELAYEESARSAYLQPGNPYAAVQAGRAAVRIGQLESALSWFERAAVDGPHEAGVLVDAASFNAAIGRTDRSTELLMEFESIRSLNDDAWMGVWEIYVSLGNLEAAERAYACGPGLGGTPEVRYAACWPDG